MTKYRVTLDFIYSDTVHVDAENEREALKEAMKECNEEFYCFYDSEIEEKAL